MENQLKPVSQHTENINATLSVSNTDIVTMLTVKNRKVIEDKKAALIDQYALLKIEAANAVKEALDTALAKTKFPAISEAYHTFLKVLMPRRKFEMYVYELDFTRLLDLVDNYLRYPERTDKFVYRFSSLTMNVKFIDEEEQQEYEEDMDYNDGDSDEHYTHNKTVKVKLQVTINMPEEAIAMRKEIDRLNNLTRDESKLKDQIIANVTEQAILGSPMLASLTGNIKMIE